jgi:penicillin-insensitive murein endopeptidase
MMNGALRGERAATAPSARLDGHSLELSDKALADGLSDTNRVGISAGMNRGALEEVVRVARKAKRLFKLHLGNGLFRQFLEPTIHHSRNQTSQKIEHAQGTIDLRTATKSMGARQTKGARISTFIFALFLTLSCAGCIHAPSPFWPLRSGSVGTPSRGVLTGGAPLANESASFVRLRRNERRYGVPRFIAAIERAASAVQETHPGARLTIGDLSAPHGGVLLPQHVSHRTGRDADLLFFLTTLEGASTESPGFLAVGPDGLAWDKEGNRFLRFDIAREWLLVRALLLDVDARVQWLFVNTNIRAMLLEWAIARGEPPYLIERAMDVMLQSGGPHDDHIHVRTACTEEEIATGCEPTGPPRPWLAQELGQDVTAHDNETSEDLARALFSPLDGL